MLLLAPLFVGCQTAGLPTVPLLAAPVVGGSSEQRSVVEAERIAIDSDLGQSVQITGIHLLETCDLPGVVCTPSYPGLLGQYADREITLDDDLSPSLTAMTLRHEVCHALPLPPSPSLAGVLPLAAAEDLALASGALVDGSLDARGEAFAQLCQYGPAYAAHLAMVCERDDPLVPSLGAYLGQVVWLGSADGGRAEALPLAATTWVPNAYADGLAAAGGNGQIIVQLYLGGDPVQAAWLDVETGESVGPAWGDDVGPAADLEMHPDLSGILGVRVEGWVGGPGAAIVDVRFGEDRVSRLYVTSDGTTWQLAGCSAPVDASGVVVVDGVLYQVWLDDHAVVNWAALPDD